MYNIIFLYKFTKRVRFVLLLVIRKNLEKNCMKLWGEKLEPFINSVMLLENKNTNDFSIDYDVNNIIEKSIEELVIGCETNLNKYKSQSSILIFNFI